MAQGIVHGEGSVSSASDASDASGLAFLPAEKLAPLDESVRESSGVAPSRTVPGWLWTHGDSGSGPWLLRFDPQTGQSEKWSVRGARNVDWEDMASFAVDGKSCLLVADVGDNNRSRASVSLHLMAEPAGRENVENAPVPLLETELTLHVTYADGPRDCEAVAVDLATRTIWLVSKEIAGNGRMFGRSGLYGLPLPEPATWATADELVTGTPELPRVLERVATLDTVMPTAMDITADGRSMLVSTYGDGLLFEREPMNDADWIDAIAAGPTRVPLPPRRQGEGLCFSAQGDAVYLTSEKPGQPVWRIPITSPARD